MTRESGLRVALCLLVPVLFCEAEENKAATEIPETELTARVPVQGYSFDVYRRSLKALVPFEYTFKISKGEKVLYNYSDYTYEHVTGHDRATAYIEVVAHDLYYAPDDTWNTVDVDKSQKFDFDGDGVSDAVVVTYTGGQGCCCGFLVFKLTPSFKLLGELQGESVRGDLEDADHDGKCEIIYGDGIFEVFLGVCHADSPSPRVALQYS
ncbi:MAG: hypothetical protein WC655_20900, partial [Candidatus Hydrogenedentales bacterium]